MQRRLPVFELVEEWYKSRSDKRPAEDLLGWLIQAFWSGELQLYHPGSETSTCREIFLRGLQEVAKNSSIVFAPTGVSKDPADDAGGEFVYVDETCVIGPADRAGWDEGTLLRAYAILAEAPVLHYPPEFLSAFRTHEVDRGEFGWLCDRRGWERPSFWFRPGERKRPQSAEHRIRAWFATKINNSEKRSKAAYFREAKRRFSISQHQFDLVWQEMALVRDRGQDRRDRVSHPQGVRRDGRHRRRRHRLPQEGCLKEGLSNNGC